MKPLIKNLSIVRGDTTSIGVTINGLDSDPVELYFSVKRNYNDKKYVFQKTLIDGIENDSSYHYIVRIDPSDTENLVSGRYVYDIELNINNTIITPVKGDLEISNDVTRHLEG